MVVLVSYVQGGAAAGSEQLHTTAKLGGKVEVSGPKHRVVKVKEAAAACEKWFDMTVVHEVYLRTDRTATGTVGIRTVTIGGARIADYCRGDCIEHPPNRERSAPANEPFVADLELIVSPSHGAGEGMAVAKCATKPGGIFAIGMLRFLRKCRCKKKHHRSAFHR